MRHYITVFEGNEKIQTYFLNVLPSFETGRITVGRLSTNDIVLPYQSVSRSHAVIELRGDVVDIIDAGSLNKLRVNGVAYERIRLADGLEVTIGTSTNTISLKYTVAPDPVPEKPQPGITKTDGGTAIFDLSSLHKEVKTQAEEPKKQSPAEEIDDVWSPMPKGTAHKAVPVPPLDNRENAEDDKLPLKRQKEQAIQPAKIEKPQVQAETDETGHQQEKQTSYKITKSFIGRRFIAFMADFVICAFMVVGAAFIMLMALNQLSGIEVIALLTFVIAILVSWVYYALCESGTTGATLGKMALGLKVVDARTMQTIDAKTATKRFFSKILSAFILFIGFLPIFGKKQTFHDYLSGTKVIKNN